MAPHAAARRGTRDPMKPLPPERRRILLGLFATALLLTSTGTLLRTQEPGTLGQRLSLPLSTVGFILFLTAGVIAVIFARQARDAA